MTERPTASTRLVALLGDPVGHSLSPVFQNAAFRAARVDGVYLALRCDPGSLPSLLRSIARAGGAGNVTLPHKALAAETVDRRTPAVDRTGACNTFWLEKGEVWGDNSDVAGFGAAVAALLGAPPTGGRVLLLGAGGAARAALQSLVETKVHEVALLNRTPGRAAELAERFRCVATRMTALDPGADLRREGFDLVVNATSLGLRPDDPDPLDPASVRRIGAALDLVYTPGETGWVRRARGRGIPAADGKEMLLQQGAAAFRRWWGKDPPLQAMRAALDEAAA